MTDKKYTLEEAVNYIADEWLHVCDVEAVVISNRISRDDGRGDGVQVLEDAETIMKAALKHALMSNEDV